MESAIDFSLAIYTRQLALQPKVTGCGDSVFSKIEHEYSVYYFYLKKIFLVKNGY
jgi:hypothetical protein